MTDIVEWLRGKPMVVNESGYTGISVAGGTLLNKAADEIERLREALSFYAEWGIDAPAVDAIIEHDRGDIARAALNEKE